MTSPAQVRADELLARAGGGQVAAVSQLITAVEARTEVGRCALPAVYANGGRAHVVGITGAPGSGKSTLVGALAAQLRARDKTVAIVAVDPSSSLSGGAILGDRIRMQQHTLDKGTFVRSMSSRGVLGGLARATVDVVAALDAAGWDYVLVETVGVGQAEVDIVRIAHTTVVVSVPGLGDDIQAIKAGLLEVADLHVVNKIDRPDANKTIKELLGMLVMSGEHREERWQIPVLGTSAADGTGVEELVLALAEHRAWLSSSGEATRRERMRAVAQIRAIAKDLLQQRIEDPALAPDYEAVVADVMQRRLDPYAAALTLIGHVATHEGTPTTKECAV